MNENTYLAFKLQTMATKPSIKKQIQKALDGRSQRWLASKARIHESDLSKKLNNGVGFTESEITRINNILKTSIAL